MSLIQKPFDDSGVGLVDDIARYGVAISRRIERLKSGQSISAAAIAFAICDVIRDIAQATGEDRYRLECARAATTFSLDSEGLDHGAVNGPVDVISPEAHNELMTAIKDILRDSDVISDQAQVTTQTILLALVWSALMFLAETVEVEEARERVRDRILQGKRPLS
jgi:hypothetical protein